MLERFRHLLQRHSLEPKMIIGPSLPVCIGPASRRVILVGPPPTHPRPLIRIEPPQRGAWEEKGWSLESQSGYQVFYGEYRVRNKYSQQMQRFLGRIEITHRGITPYICKAPEGIRSHPKGPCFSRVDQSWYRIHWHRPPSNVDDAILYMERILDEVINRRLV